jgi:hypothetical protein
MSALAAMLGAHSKHRSESQGVFAWRRTVRAMKGAERSLNWRAQGYAGPELALPHRHLRNRTLPLLHSAIATDSAASRGRLPRRACSRRCLLPLRDARLPTHSRSRSVTPDTWVQKLLSASSATRFVAAKDVFAEDRIRCTAKLSGRCDPSPRLSADASLCEVGDCRVGFADPIPHFWVGERT